MNPEQIASSIQRQMRKLAEAPAIERTQPASAADENVKRRLEAGLLELAGRAPMARARKNAQERLDDEIRRRLTALSESVGRLAPRAAVSSDLGEAGGLENEIRKATATLAEYTGRLTPRRPEGAGGEIPAALRPPMEKSGSTAIHIVKNSFNGGEISPGLGARLDQPRYQNGCLRMLNMIPLAEGGATKRPGMACAGVAAGSPNRLFSFVFSATEARICEFYGQGGKVRMRVWKPDGSFCDSGLSLPWQPAWLNDVCFSQCADVIYCASAHFSPGKIMRYADDDWRWATIEWGPAIQPPALAGIATGGTWPEGNSTYMMRQYAVTSVDEDGNESEPNTDIVIWGIPPLSQSFYVTIAIAPVEGASEYRFYKYEAGVYGYIGRMESADMVFEDRNIAPDTEDTPPGHKNPFVNDYPTLVFSHQQRLGFAASPQRPLTVWMSVSGNHESMASSLPPRDDDAIEATLAASQANVILWAVSDRAGLCLGTSGGEWLLEPADGGALTPKNISFQPQTSWGSKPGLMPLSCGNGLIFCQRGGQVIRNLGYSFQDDRYRAQDLSLLSRHILSNNPVVAWCWQPEPFGIVWMALQNGQMAGLTWLPEHEVIAWHSHSTAGEITDVATIPGPDGNSQLWLAVNRSGITYIETLRPFVRSGAWPVPPVYNEAIPSMLADDAGEAASLPGTIQQPGEPARSLPPTSPQASDHYDGVNNAPFPCRVIPLLESPNTQTGNAFLHLQKINFLKARVINSAPFHCRVISQIAKPSRLMPIPARNSTFTARADWTTIIAAGFRDDTMLELVMDGPEPCTILALTIALELAGESGGQG